jgi:hypothetical protein
MKRLLLTTGAVLMLSGTAFAQTSHSTATTETRNQGQSTTSGSTATGNSSRAESKTTMSGNRSAMNDDQSVVQNLEKQGYSNVKVTGHNQGHVNVMASKDGQNQQLSVDPATGKVMRD